MISTRSVVVRERGVREYSTRKVINLKWMVIKKVVPTNRLPRSNLTVVFGTVATNVTHLIHIRLLVTTICVTCIYNKNKKNIF